MRIVTNYSIQNFKYLHSTNHRRPALMVCWLSGSLLVVKVVLSLLSSCLWFVLCFWQIKFVLVLVRGHFLLIFQMYTPCFQKQSFYYFTVGYIRPFYFQTSCPCSLLGDRKATWGPIHGNLQQFSVLR